MTKRDETVTHTTDHVWLSPDGAILAVLSGEAKGATLPVPSQVGSVVRVGKSRDNELVLPDNTVSRHHMTVERMSDGLRIRDLDSMNGVRIGGVLVREALVEPGTILFVGDTQVLVRVATRSVVIPPSEADRFGHARGRSLAMRRVSSSRARAVPRAAGCQDSRRLAR